MTKSALIYAWAVILTGMVVLGCAILGGQSWNDTTFLVYLGLAAFAATFKVRLPNLTGTLSPAFAFLLMAIATRSWSETVVIAVVSAIVQCLWRPRSRPTYLQLAFNASAMAISGGVAHSLARSASAGGVHALPVILGAAGVALLVSNTLLLSTILCLIQEGPFEMIWRSVQLWAVPYYVGGGLLAGIWANAEFHDAIPVILALLSAYVLSACYRELIGLRRVSVQ